MNKENKMFSHRFNILKLRGFVKKDLQMNYQSHANEETIVELEEWLEEIEKEIKLSIIPQNSKLTA